MALKDSPVRRNMKPGDTVSANSIGGLCGMIFRICSRSIRMFITSLSWYIFMNPIFFSKNTVFYKQNSLLLLYGHQLVQSTTVFRQISIHMRGYLSIFYLFKDIVNLY